MLDSWFLRRFVRLLRARIERNDIGTMRGMKHPVYEKGERLRLGEEIYEREIRERVEPEHDGRMVAVDVETGDYFLADRGLNAFLLARRERPDGAFCLLRVGRVDAYRIGSRPSIVP